jgi:hypothetical protein
MPSSILEAATPVTKDRVISDVRGMSNLDDADRMFNRLVELKVSTAQLAMHMDSDWRHGLFGKLDELLDADEWNFEDRLPEVASYRTMLRLLLALKAKRSPALGATVGGQILVGWIYPDRRLTIQCGPSDEVQWSVSTHLAGQPAKAAGKNKINLLSKVLAPFEPRVLLDDAANP